MHLIQRRDAAQSTLDTFGGRELAYGVADCVRMAAFDLRLLGYKPRLARGGRYGSLLGARKALKRAGFDSLEDALDALELPRIGHARMMAGDIVALNSDEAGWPALGVALGNYRVLAFSTHTGRAGVARAEHHDILHVWKADPCPRP